MIDNTAVEELLCDRNGNYIVQKALFIAKGDQRSKILYLTGRCFNKLKKISYGPILIDKLIKQYPEIKSYLDPKFSNGFKTQRIPDQQPTIQYPQQSNFMYGNFPNPQIFPQFYPQQPQMMQINMFPNMIMPKCYPLQGNMMLSNQIPQNININSFVNNPQMFRNNNGFNCENALFDYQAQQSPCMPVNKKNNKNKKHKI